MIRRSKPLPTDLEILNAIYNRYYDTFIAYVRDVKPERVTRLLVPIDIEAIASGFNVDPDIVFGRLYYHLEQKHGYRTKDGDARVVFFEKEIAGGDRDVVNFALLSSVLAGLRYEHETRRDATGLAITALVLSLISIVISVVR